MSTVTVEELNQWASDIFELRAKKDEIEEKLSELNKSLQVKERQVIEALKELNLTTFKASTGTLTQYDKVSYAVPKTPEDRQSFFDYLKEKQVFDGMVTVHHATLNAYVEKEFEAAKDAGDLFFTVPGLGAPTITTILSKTKKKGN